MRKQIIVNWATLQKVMLFVMWLYLRTPKTISKINHKMARVLTDFLVEINGMIEFNMHFFHCMEASQIE